MGKLKLAVFGHYDSRGGTTAIPLHATDTPTMADVQAAIKEYNQIFYWEEDLALYRKDPSGWGWDPTQPGSSPGEQDFMYVADLHYQGELPDGDLDSGNRKVVIDSATEPGGGPLAWATIDQPTQLEFVEMPDGYDRDIVAHEKGNRDLREAIGGYTFSSTWTPEQKAEAERLNAIDDGLEATRNSRVVAACKFINKEKAEVRRWDDDAFGFIIGTGL